MTKNQVDSRPLSPSSRNGSTTLSPNSRPAVPRNTPRPACQLEEHTTSKRNQVGGCICGFSYGVTAPFPWGRVRVSGMADMQIQRLAWTQWLHAVLACVKSLDPASVRDLHAACSCERGKKFLRMLLGQQQQHDNLIHHSTSVGGDTLSLLRWDAAILLNCRSAPSLGCLRHRRFLERRSDFRLTLG